MADTTNVVEVDFNRKDDKRTLSDLCSDLQAVVASSGEGIAHLRDLTRGIRADFDWYYDQWRRERSRARRLERELLKERARGFACSDEDVLEAIRSIYSGEALAAGAVAATLFGGEPTHSTRVRTGQALSRLANCGQVIRHPSSDNGRVPCRWEPVSAQ